MNNSDIQKTIKEAEDLVKASKIDREFFASAYGVVLAHLLRGKGVMRTSPTSPVGDAPADKASSPATQQWSDVYEQKQPQGTYQVIALAVDYLSRQQLDDQEESVGVKKHALMSFLENKCYEHIGQLTNLTKAISNTVAQSRYIRSVGKGVYNMTPLGRKMLKQLPEQPPATKKKAKKKKKQ